MKFVYLACTAREFSLSLEAIASRQLKSLILRVDSEYVTRAIAKYLPQWEQVGYVARVGRPVKYGEEFARIAQLMKMIKAGCVWH